MPTDQPNRDRRTGDDVDDVTNDDHPSVEEVVQRLDRLWNEFPDEPDASPASGSQPGSLSELIDQNLTGRRIGRYSVERVIGSGGHGVVYKALDHQLNRQVAIKVPRPEVLLDDEKRRRFESEAQTAARLDHPSIVPVHEAQLSGATPYIVSMYCPGPNLLQWMNQDTAPPTGPQAAEFISHLAKAVHYAHEHGVVHRDLKPSNVLLVAIRDTETQPRDNEQPSLADYHPRLTDFGLAQLAESRLEDTRSSLMMGTPLYMSPEQAECRHADVGPGTDVFALGAILYHMLTGSPPFAADNYPAVLARLRDEEPTPMGRTDLEIDPDLETICMKCLQRTPGDRYISAADLADDLNRYRAGQPITARPVSAAQRLRRWSLQPTRVVDATATVIVMALVRVCSTLIGLWFIAALYEVPPTRAEIAEVLLIHFLITIPCDVWFVWAARRNLQRLLSPSQYWSALSLSLAWATLALLIAGDVLPAPLWYQRMPGARTLVFSLMGVLFAAQSVGWYFADWNRVDTRGSNLRRRNGKLIALSAPVVVVLAALLISRGSVPSDPVYAGPTDSIVLDGEDDYVAIPSVGFAEAEPFTMEAWIRPDDSRAATIIQYGPLSMQTVTAGDGNRFRVGLSDSEETMFLIDTDTKFQMGHWAHVAVTYDTNSVRLFFNGQPQEMITSQYRESGVNRIDALPDPLILRDVWPGSLVYFGANHETYLANANPFAGQIGEVRLSRSVFYRGAFTPRTTLSPSADTEFLFHLDQGAAEEVIDATGQYVGAIHRWD